MMCIPHNGAVPTPSLEVDRVSAFQGLPVSSSVRSGLPAQSRQRTRDVRNSRSLRDPIDALVRIVDGWQTLGLEGDSFGGPTRRRQLAASDSACWDSSPCDAAAE